MEHIEIYRKHGGEQEGRMDFIVVLGDSGTDAIGFLVHADEDYWMELTGGKRPPEELIKKTFEFLLSKEGRLSILREFDCRQVQEYFPEYEEAIRKKMKWHLF